MCSNAKTILRILFGTVLVSGVAASAQSKDRVEVAVNYTAARTSSITGGFWMQGGSVQLDAKLWRYMGIAADFTGLHTANVNKSGTGLDVVATTFGPRFAWKLPANRQSNVSLFAHGLVGEAHGMNSVFPSSSGTKTGDLSFVTKAGGGIEIKVAQKLAIRVLEADWLRTQFPNAGTNAQNLFQASSGLAVSF